jgi:hypothetical protein
MAVEWTKDTLVTLAIVRAEHSGGMTAQERTALVERFGVSEEVLLRCERAYHAHYSLIGEKQWDQAVLEATLRMRELGKRGDEPELVDEIERALCRIRAATPENEITREYDEAWVALRVALDGPTSADSDR